MRQVQVAVGADKREAVLLVLDEQDIDYVLTEASGGPKYDVTVFFPLPTEAVEPVLESLEDIGVNEQGLSVTMSAESVVSRDFEELQAEYEQSSETDDQMAFEELRMQARELLPKGRTFVLLSAVSAIVATAGLLLDSPAIVVGSMVIAPLVGPAMSTSVGSVLDDERYAALTQMETNVQYSGGPVSIEPDPSRVVVTVSRPDGQPYPDLAERIDARIEAGRETSVTVEVRYVDTASAA
jgi:hypothetical protein